MKKIILSLILGLAVLVGVFLAQLTENAVNDTIAQTFPDANLAQAVADKVASNRLPKTGGFEYLLMGLITLLAGLLLSTRGFKKIIKVECK